MLSFFGFGNSVAIEIKLDGESDRQLHYLRDQKNEGLPIYTGTEPIKGSVVINCKDGFDYDVLKIEFIGEIEHTLERGKSNRFVHLESYLGGDSERKFKGPTGALPFSFPNVVKQHDSYHGYNVFIRYFLRFICERSFAADYIEEKAIWVEHYSAQPEINNPLKMEVGIEDCLHIEFEYNQQKYHLHDAIVGKIYFLLIRIKLKFMELELVRREWAGAHADAIVESELLAQFEVMDGSPVKGESIPVRFYLSPVSSKLTPTYVLPNMKFAVRYFLNVVLVDEDDRRYFKQSEIHLWRTFPELQDALF